MGFFDKLIRFFEVDEELEEEFENDYEDDSNEHYSRKYANRHEREKGLDILSNHFHKQTGADEEKVDFSFHILRAVSCDVFHEVAHILKSGDCVALSIKGMDPYEAQRLTDCICGAIYSLDGHIEIEKTKPDVLILTPNSIEISTGSYASIFSRLAAF